jgi:hypothetical protein
MAELVAQLQRRTAAKASGSSSSNAYLIRGPIKRPSRALQKLVRLYDRNPACLTDLVRCTTVVAGLHEAAEFLMLVAQKSVIGFDFDDQLESSRLVSSLLSGADTDNSGKIMRITQLKNRSVGVCMSSCTCSYTLTLHTHTY